LEIRAVPSEYGSRMVNRTVIHVDDDRGMRELTRRALGKADKNVDYLGTDSGSKGLRWIEESREPARLVLLMDLHMPEMSGFDILTSLAERHLLGRFPVIMLSSSEHDEDRERGLALGATRFCIKPMDFKNLVDVMKQNMSISV
jgi:DNA-binding response OmpR family regulator